MADGPRINLNPDPKDVGALFTHSDDTKYIVNILDNMHGRFPALVYVHEGTDFPDLSADSDDGYSTYGGHQADQNQFQIEWNGTDNIYMWASRDIQISIRPR